MNRKKRSQASKRAAAKNRAVSTVFGTILFLILVISASATLFLALNNFNDSVKQAAVIEDERSQEKIVMTALTLVNQTIDGSTIETITGINITNLGSITSQVKAFYVDNKFVCDPSNVNLNPQGAFIKPQDWKIVNLQPVPFNPESSITVATSRGIMAVELESNFLNRTSSGFVPMTTNYGPLRLNFTLFYYRETDQNGIPIGPWQPGSNVSSTASYVAWNITVTDIDTRDITLDQYSSLTLVTNEGGSQFPWYTTNPNQVIAANQTVTIVYLWETQLPCLKAQSFTGFSGQTAKVFLTFYGKFSDGATYGQTIPFEAILRK